MMKKIGLNFIICIFGFWFLMLETCLAAPVGNPAEPVLLHGKYPTKFSLQTETVFKRKLEAGSSGQMRFSGTFHTGKVSLYLGEKLDIYGLVGVYDGKVKDFISEYYIIDSKMDAAMGLGASYVLHEWEFANGICRLGADAKYRQYEPDIDTVKFYREAVTVSDTAMTFKEWQLALGLAYQYKNFIPYVGVKYSDVDAHIKFTHGANDRTDNDIASDNTWGLFYGADVLVQDNISVNIEGRNMDENAVNVGLNVRF